MENKKFRSIKVKLVLLFSISAIIAILTASIAMFTSTYHELEAQSKISLANTAEILAKNLSAPIEFDDVGSAEALLQTLEIDTDIVGAFIFRDKDKQFASYVKENEIRESLEKKIDAIFSSKGTKENSEFIDKNNIIVNSPIFLDNDYIATFSIVASTESLNNSVLKQLIVAAISSLLALLLVTLLALKLQTIFTNPIFLLKNIMEDVTHNHNYSIRIDNNNHDEFGTLFDGFNNMIDKINEQNLALEDQKEFVRTLLNSQEQLIITTRGNLIIDANTTLLNFFNVDSVEEFHSYYNENSICDMFNKNAPDGYLQIMMGDKNWIDYVISNSSRTHKVMITLNEEDHIFSVNATNLPNDLQSAVFTDITEMEEAKQEIDALHKHTRESIEYASLLQGAILPDEQLMSNHFKDYFVHWLPKDTVGGDIWLFNEFGDENECLLFFIDCTGHGVPGAFVTMIVKAIEREIIAKIKENSDMEISPAWIMGYFNKTMKILLKQETKDSLSNAGWDGGIIYYNKKDKILKFAGAETPLFYIGTDGKLNTIKGNRYSVGYRKCAMDYEYKETIIDVKEGMKFYCTTDGYLDQNGGEKDFPFGKKRFTNILKEQYKKPMLEQKEILINEIQKYEEMVLNNDRNDDMTVIAFEI